MKEQLTNYTTKRAKQEANKITWILYYSGAIKYYYDSARGTWETYFRYWHPLFYTAVFIVIFYNMYESFKESASDLNLLVKENKIPKKVKYTYARCLKEERDLEKK